MSFAAAPDPMMRARRWLVAAALAMVFAAYIALATVATLFTPAMLVLFLSPFVWVIISAAPAAPCVPTAIIKPLILTAALLMPFWPVYLHVQLGSLPILTPPRIIFYALTLFWLWDMVFSRYRRAVFVYNFRHGRFISGFVAALFVVGAVSVATAEGKSLAAQEYIRQLTIWLLPFLVFLTYVRRDGIFKLIVVLFAIGAGLDAMIGILEISTGTSLASVLSPFIADNAEWLRNTQEAKLRDGVFRAQATHTHPLSLGEYLAMAAPIALAFVISQRRARWFWAVLLIVIIGGIIGTNARGAFLAASAGLFLAASVFAFRALRQNPSSRLAPLAGLISLMIIISSPVIGFGAYKVIAGAPGTSEARSSQARLDQIEAAWPKILKRPVGGYGAGRAARIVGYWGRTITIDNYFLSLAVDYGFPGPILFLGLLGAVAIAARAQSIHGPPSMHMMWLGLACAIVAFTVMRTILSQTGNLSTLYPLFGAVAAMNARLSYRRALTGK